MNILAVILNFFCPGVGSFVVGAGGAGIAQLLIFGTGLFMVMTLIMLPIGVILMGVAWIWGLITAATVKKAPQQIVVVETRADQ
ncbi:hypothetical protein [uncultured Roseobacter sp.]|uniref:hypothetical protein n=1 Tax=uncultured Roseobacter sp. TaxID=114847 RepID=UPI002603367C|nr:hypothetical protein [uncultured Roseobacter sp.]